MSKKKYKPKISYKKSYTKSRRNYNGDKRYKEWRQAVRARDDRSCRWPGCKKKNRGIQVHHIKKWATNPALRYVVSNGICLCRAHHNKIKGKEELYERLFYEILVGDISQLIDDYNESI